MMQVGLLGKPNVGKSTFFKAATLNDVEVANYPFTTIKANVGVGHVSIECPKQDCNPNRGACMSGTRFVPVKIYDVAGLVPDAHKGKGLGNQFLDDARKAQVLIMVVDASGRTDSEGNRAEGDPVEDVRFILEEFDRWTAGIIEKLTHKRGDTEELLLEGLSGLEVRQQDVKKVLRSHSPSNAMDFARALRQEAKPVLIAANRMDLPGADEWLEKLEKLEQPVVPTSAVTEMLIRKASEGGFIEYVPGRDSFQILKSGSEEQADALEFARKYLKKYGHTGVQKVLNKAVFELGNRIAVFPVEDETHWTDGAGNILPDCLLVRRGTTAKELAYKVHTDIGEGFVKAVDARTGRTIGSDHELEHLDIIKIQSR